ncbi:unnamed protein product [Effrenium voratum]|nr:unnamed protein product [Effrenium voratum]
MQKQSPSEEYPDTRGAVARSDVAPAQGTGARAMLAQALSAACSQELAGLGEAWQLQSMGRGLEEAGP